MGHLKFFAYATLAVILAVIIFKKGIQGILVIIFAVVFILFIKYLLTKPKKEPVIEREFDPNDDFIDLYISLGMKEDFETQKFYPYYLGVREDEKHLVYAFKANGNKVDVFIKNKEILEEFLSNFSGEHLDIHKIIRAEKEKTIIEILIRKEVNVSRLDVEEEINSFNDPVVEVDEEQIEKVELKDDEIKINEDISWKFRKDPHMLINGGTGGGKTFFIFYLLIILSKIKASVRVLDPKHSDLSLLGRKELLGKANVAYKHEEIAKVMLEAVKEMYRRSEAVEKIDLSELKVGMDYKDHGFKPLFIIFDEYMAFMRGGVEPKVKKEVEKAVLEIIAQGRQLGVFMVIAMQRGSAKAIDTDVRAQFHFRCSLGHLDADGYTMVFGENYNLKKTLEGKGSGFIQIADNKQFEEPQEFYTPYISKKFDLLKELQTIIREDYTELELMEEKKELDRRQREFEKKIVQGNFRKEEPKAVNQNDVVIDNLEDIDIEDLRDIPKSNDPDFKPKK